MSEAKAVLRSLYQMYSSGDPKYIGICRDESINGLLHKSGLGSYVIDLDDLNIFNNSNDKCPGTNDLQLFMRNNPNKYEICCLHDKLRNDERPVCAKVKAEFIADFIQKYESDVKETIDSLIKMDNN